MQQVSRRPYAMEALDIGAFKRTLERLASMMIVITGALGDCLGRQQHNISCVYFLGDNDLIEIIGDSGEPSKVIPYIGGMFEIPLVTLDTHSKLDVAIDGADEVDPDLNLVNSGRGALLCEKMVEVCADKFIVIIDESKLTDGLGPGFPVPFEITPFCHEHTLCTAAALPSCEGCKPVLCMGFSAFGLECECRFCAIRRR